MVKKQLFSVYNLKYMIIPQEFYPCVIGANIIEKK